MSHIGGLGGFEVSFLPEYKALHEAGYNILAYDMRNHGTSGQGNGGIVGIGTPDGYERFDRAVQERTGFRLDEQSPIEHARAVTVPTLVVQVHDDTITRPEDVQSIYDGPPAEDKQLYWISGTERRFDGYNYFGQHPEVPIDWFDKHFG